MLGVDSASIINKTLFIFEEVRNKLLKGIVMKKSKYTAIYHYGNDDTDFSGDYYCIEFFDEEGTEVAYFGDYYHDKGNYKLEGFIKGIEYATKSKVELIIKKIADGDKFI